MAQNEQDTVGKSPDEILESTILKSLKDNALLTDGQVKNLNGKLSTGILKAADWERLFAEDTSSNPETEGQSDEPNTVDDNETR